MREKIFSPLFLEKRLIFNTHTTVNIQRNWKQRTVQGLKGLSEILERRAQYQKIRDHSFGKYKPFQNCF